MGIGKRKFIMVSMRQTVARTVGLVEDFIDRGTASYSGEIINNYEYIHISFIIDFPAFLKQ